jgi:hypothetical protein
VGRGVARILHAEAAEGQGEPVFPEIKKDGDERAGVQSDVEGFARILPMEQPREENQVGGAADGQKLGQGLNQGEYDRLKKRHECVDVLCRRQGDRRDFGRSRLARDAADGNLSERLDNDSRDACRRQRRQVCKLLF